jgi:uncharacterized membrane protein (UPF0127 family)
MPFGGHPRRSIGSNERFVVLATDFRPIAALGLSVRSCLARREQDNTGLLFKNKNTRRDCSRRVAPKT